MKGGIVFKGKKRAIGISPLDRSFNAGDGLFETIKVSGGKTVWIKEHLERMFASARFTGISCQLTMAQISKACQDFVKKEKIKEGWLRVTLSRGESKTGRFADMPKEAVLAIIGGSAKADGSPLKVGFSDWPLNENDPATSHKTTSRFSMVTAWRSAQKKRLDELVFLNTKGKVAEGIISNIFWLEEGVLLTPSERCGILPGIAREKVLAAAKAVGIRAEAGEFTAQSLNYAEAIFFTNSIWLMRPCGEFCGKVFSDVDNKNFVLLRDFVLKQI